MDEMDKERVGGDLGWGGLGGNCVARGLFKLSSVHSPYSAWLAFGSRGPPVYEIEIVACSLRSNCGCPTANLSPSTAQPKPHASRTGYNTLPTHSSTQVAFFNFQSRLLLHCRPGGARGAFSLLSFQLLDTLLLLNHRLPAHLSLLREGSS
jgi:hypothetical protein